MGFSGTGFTDEKHRLSAFEIATFRQDAYVRGRDVRRLREVELLQRLDPRQVRVLEAQLDRAPFAVFDFGLEQSFEVVKMRVVLPAGFFSQRYELRTHRGEAERLAVLDDACRCHAHACTSVIAEVSNCLYSIIVGNGRSYAASTPISIVCWATCCN